MKIFFKILTFLWLVIFLFIGISIFLDTPNQKVRDKEFITNNIKPSVDFIENFKITNNRLPTNREYYTWQRNYHNDFTSDLTQTQDSLIAGLGRINYITKLTEVAHENKEKFDDADWTKDYAIAVWRGEWMEYYFSWSDSYNTNNYSWIDGVVGMLGSIIIGCIPVSIWILKRRREAHNTI